MMAPLVAGVARLVSGATARWAGCRPDTRQRIYFSNHTSHLDAVVIWSVLPPPVRLRTRPVAARDYWSASAARRYLAVRVFNAVLIDRRNPTPGVNPIDVMIDAMGADGSLIFFPEGTRGFNADPGPFKSGLFHLARRAPGAELIPVLVDNLNRILPKGEVLPVPLLGSVSFGAAIRLAEGEAKPDFLERARRSIIELRNP